MLIRGEKIILDASLVRDGMMMEYPGLQRVHGDSLLGHFHYAPIFFSAGRRPNRVERALIEVLALLLEDVQGILWLQRQEGPSQVLRWTEGGETGARSCSLMPSDLVLDPARPEFRLTNLKTASVHRLHKLATIHGSMVVRHLGTLPQSRKTTVAGKLRDLLADW